MRSFLLISLILTPLMSVFSQDKDLKIQKFLITTHDNKRYEGKNGILTIDHFSWTEGGGETRQILREQIKSLYQYKGSKVVTMGLLGGLTGFVIGIGSIYINVDNGETVSNSAKGNTLAILTAAGTLIGGGIGASSSNWEKIKL